MSIYDYDLVQGSEEWKLARSGCLTSTSFKVLVTSTGKVSKAATVTEHAAYLAALRVVGSDNEFYESAAMRRGVEMEPEARRYYEFQTGNKVEQVGIVYADSEQDVTCSPDGLIDEPDSEGILRNGGLEIKCPGLKAHTIALWNDAVPSEYVMQVQGNMFVTGRDWWDFMSYHPQLPPLIKRIPRNEEIQNSLGEAIPPFIKLVAEIEKFLRGKLNVK